MERAQVLEQLQSLQAAQDRHAEELRLVEGRMGQSETLIQAVAHRKLDAHEGRKMFNEVEKVLEAQYVTLNDKFEEIHGAFVKEFETLTNTRLVEQDQNLNASRLWSITDSRIKKLRWTLH